MTAPERYEVDRDQAVADKIATIDQITRTPWGHTALEVLRQAAVALPVEADPVIEITPARSAITVQTRHPGAARLLGAVLGLDMTEPPDTRWADAGGVYQTWRKPHTPAIHGYRAVCLVARKDVS